MSPLANSSTWLSTSSAVVGAELAQQKAAALGQKLDVVESQLLLSHGAEQQPVEAFETDRPVLENRRHIVCGEKGSRQSREPPDGDAAGSS